MRAYLGDNQRLINYTMIAAVLLVVVRTALLGIHEVVPFGAEVGELLYDGGLAYATAWLFQWLVVARPDRARRQLSNRVVAVHVYELVRPGKELVYTLRKSTSREGPGWPPRKEDVELMCAEVQTSQPPPEHLFQANWWGYLGDLQQRRREAQRGLEPFYDRMDEELLSLLNAERAAGMMIRHATAAPIEPSSETLRAFGSDFWGWLETIEAIRNHHDSVLAPGSYAPDERY